MRKRLYVAMGAIAIMTTSLAVRARHDTAPPALTRDDEPGGTVADAKLASSNPDEYAWQLFFFINRQASDRAAGVPDSQEATFLDDKPGAAVVWEGWALASGDQESEVFNGCLPKPWKALTNRQAIPGTALSLNLTELVDKKLSKSAGQNTSRHPDQHFINPKGLIENEVEIRYNQETYETIVQNQLWSREFINRKVQEEQTFGEKEFVTFPVGAKAVKAAWVELCGGGVSCPEMSRYHWREATDVTGTHIYGLAALHIMTKEKGMPNWFWADFIHVDCFHGQAPCLFPTPKPHVGDLNDSTAGSDGIRRETRGSAWENYRLMGTETAFTSDGHDNELSDPRIETNESNPSSCITCHDYASTRPIKATDVPTENLPVLQPDKLKILGEPDERVLNGSAPGDRSAGQKPAREYIQSDFLWSMDLLSQSQQSCPVK